MWLERILAHEARYTLDVVRLGEQIEQLNRLHVAAALLKKLQVAGQRRRAAGDILKTLGPEGRQQLQGARAHAAARRVENNQVRRGLGKTPQEVVNRLGDSAHVIETVSAGVGCQVRGSSLTCFHTDHRGESLRQRKREQPDAGEEIQSQ